MTYVKSKCSGIVGANGILPIRFTDDGWRLHLLSRLSFRDPLGADMTVIDLPLVFYYSTPYNGGMEIYSSSAEALMGYFGVHNADLPTCTTIEIVDVTVEDPNGLPFAKLGSATRP